MQKERALLLKQRAAEVAEMFSRDDRGGNFLNEQFSVETIHVLGETTAAVVFFKRPTGKRAVAWFYFVNSRAKPRWEYFFITYAHLAGLDRVSSILADVEQSNFELNFSQERASP